MEDIDHIVKLIADNKFYMKDLKNKSNESKVKRLRYDNKITRPQSEICHSLKKNVSDFMCNNILRTTFESYEFTKSIYESFSEAVDKYAKIMMINRKSISFLFCGGNILRLVHSDRLKYLNFKSLNVLNEYFYPCFKKSDAYFSLFIDPSTPSFDIVYQDMISLIYLIMNRHRNIVSSNMPKYFSFYTLNDEQRKNLLKKMLNENDDIEHVQIGNDYYSENKIDPFEYVTDYDEIIFNKKSKNKKTHESSYLTPPKNETMTNDDSLLQITLVENIHDKLNVARPKKIIDFNLCKLKMSICIKFKNMDDVVYVDGDLVNVVIPKREDWSLIKYFENEGKSHSKFKIREMNNFEFEGLSLGYVIDDLENNLFSKLLWDDCNYAKKVKQLMYLHFLFLMNNSMSQVGVKILYIEMIKNVIISYKKYIKDENINMSRNIVQSQLTKMDGPKNNKRVFPFKCFVQNLLDTLDVYDLYSTNNMKIFVEYLELIIECMDVMDNSLRENQEFIDDSNYNKNIVY